MCRDETGLWLRWKYATWLSRITGTTQRNCPAAGMTGERVSLSGYEECGGISSTAGHPLWLVESLASVV